MVGLRAQGQMPWGGRGPRALGASRARSAVGLRELDRDDRVAPRVLVRRPGGVLLPVRAGYPVGLPVNAEVAEVIPCPAWACQLASGRTGPIISTPCSL